LIPPNKFGGKEEKKQSTSQLQFRIVVKKYISIVLILLMLVIPAASFAQEEPKSETAVSEEAIAQCKIDGRQYASQHYHGWRWFGAGFGGGFALGLIGSAVAIGFSQTGTAVPPAEALNGIQDQPQPYQDAFRLGYHQKARSKALGKCILGSVAGMGIIIAIFVAESA
jgi:hypothetical protein